MPDSAKRREEVHQLLVLQLRNIPVSATKRLHENKY
jgi:hypothetical protein